MTQVESSVMTGQRSETSAKRESASYRLALGFGTTVLMWAVGYVSRVPPAVVPSGVLLVMLLLCQLAGGWCAGRFTRDGVRAGLATGAISALLNLLVLGSLLTGHEPNRLVPSALLWLPGSFLVALVMGAAGASIGASARARATRAPSGPKALTAEAWTAIFALIASIATFFLLIVGGLVTSEKAGLAVVDWPNSYGYAMFLYPLSRMTGGVYYEHAHRLFGSLVGLTTLVLTAHLWRVEPRAWVKRLSLAALLAVIVQGMLGGLRVTGKFTLSDDPSQTAPSLLLAVVHGVFGQVFFGMLVALAVVTSPAWRRDLEPTRHEAAASDHKLTAWLVAALVVQLVFGAILRHFSNGTLIHIVMACAVLMLGLFVAVRAFAVYAGEVALRRLGLALMLSLGLQLLLGVGSLVVTGFAKDAPTPPAYEVIVTTAHQANGALLLALSVALALWTQRRVAIR